MAPREGPTPPYGAPPSPPPSFRTTWELGGGWQPPLAYIRRCRPPPFSIISLSSLSLSLSPTSSGPPLFGVCTWLGVLHQKQAVALPESGSGSVFFPLLAWFGARREHRLHCTCVTSL